MKGFLTGLAAVVVLATATYFTIGAVQITAVERTAENAMIVVGEMTGNR